MQIYKLLGSSWFPAGSTLPLHVEVRGYSTKIFQVYSILYLRVWKIFPVLEEISKIILSFIGAKNYMTRRESFKKLRLPDPLKLYIVGLVRGWGKGDVATMYNHAMHCPQTFRGGRRYFFFTII